jgi:hypothetical protein
LLFLQIFQASLDDVGQICFIGEVKDNEDIGLGDDGN